MFLAVGRSGMAAKSEVFRVFRSEYAAVHQLPPEQAPVHGLCFQRLT
jgi:hypothetical protein